MELAQELQKITIAYADASRNLVKFNTKNEAFTNLMNGHPDMDGELGDFNSINQKRAEKQVRKVNQIFYILTFEEIKNIKEKH